MPNIQRFGGGAGGGYKAVVLILSSSTQNGVVVSDENGSVTRFQTWRDTMSYEDDYIRYNYYGGNNWSCTVTAKMDCKVTGINSATWTDVSAGNVAYSNSGGPYDGNVKPFILVIK